MTLVSIGSFKLVSSNTTGVEYKVHIILIRGDVAVNQSGSRYVTVLHVTTKAHRTF